MSFIQTIVNRSNTIIYVPNQLIPFVCVFIIAKTPAILLVGFVLGYMMIQPTIIETNTIHNDIKMIEAPLPVNNLDDGESDMEEENVLNLLMENNGQRVLTKSSALLLDDNTMSNSSIDFENLMKFPSCPTTLPRLDTHFNFVIDHDIKSPDPSEIDWPAINQEMEYDQQRQNVVDNCNQNASVSQHPLLLLHQLQQENLSMMFSEDEEDNSLSSIYSNNKSGTNMVVQEEKTINYNSITARIPFHTDAAILFVDNEEDLRRETAVSIDIEDLLLLPSLPIPTKPSLSSPGQLFKSKFQKAVKKMKKSSHLSRHDDLDKRSSTFSGNSSKRAASLQLDSYFPQDPLFTTPLSPRPSASARVHDHFKGRLNKLFKK